MCDVGELQAEHASAAQCCRVPGPPHAGILREIPSVRGLTRLLDEGAMRSDRRVGTGHATGERELRDRIRVCAIQRTAILVVPLTLAVAASACGSSTPPLTTPSDAASLGHSPTPSTFALPQGCTDAVPCVVTAGHYTLSEVGVVPGLSLTVPSAGWRSTEQDQGELNLIPSDRPNDRLFVWDDLNAVKSTGAGHGTTVLSHVGTTAQALISWITTNPDLLVVSTPAPATIGAGIASTSLVVGVSQTAQYGDPACPTNPRCADLFTNRAYWGTNSYGIGGPEVVHLYFIPITLTGASQTLFVALDAADTTDLAHLAAEAAPILDTIHLPAGALAG
jgi:hypothetical protein